MIEKFMAAIELWIGLGLFIALLNFIPVIGVVIAGVLGSIVGIISQIPYYSILMAVLGSILFFDGLRSLFWH